MLSPNLCRSEGRRPSHITLGTVRLWASNDIACGKTHIHTPSHTTRLCKTSPIKTQIIITVPSYCGSAQHIFTMNLINTGMVTQTLQKKRKMLPQNYTFLTAYQVSLNILSCVIGPFFFSFQNLKMGAL